MMMVDDVGVTMMMMMACSMQHAACMVFSGMGRTTERHLPNMDHGRGKVQAGTPSHVGRHRSA